MQNQITINEIMSVFLCYSFQVHVHTTLSHGERFSRVHSPAALWVESVSTRGFKVCARESGIGTNGTGIINWLAFQDQPQMTHGSVSFSGIWTTESKCEKVTFSQVRRNGLLQISIMEITLLTNLSLKHIAELWCRSFCVCLS